MIFLHSLINKPGWFLGLDSLLLTTICPPNSLIPTKFLIHKIFSLENFSQGFFSSSSKAPLQIIPIHSSSKTTPNCLSISCIRYVFHPYVPFARGAPRNPYFSTYFKYVFLWVFFYLISQVIIYIMIIDLFQYEFAIIWTLYDLNGAWDMVPKIFWPRWHLMDNRMAHVEEPWGGPWPYM